MLDRLDGVPHLSIERFDLPVHHPLYDENGLPGRLSHVRTVVELLRAVVRVPRVDVVVLFGSSDVCFSYGLAFVLCAKLFRRRCAARMTGGRAVFGTSRLPAPIRAACLAMFRAIDAFLVETEAARSDLPAKLRSKTTIVRGFRPRPLDPPPIHRDEQGTRFAFVGRAGAGESASSPPEKGLDVLLDAFDLMRAASVRQSGPGSADCIELHVYGPIPVSLVERVRRTTGIVAYGMVPNVRLAVALGRHDVLAFPSRYAFEGHPGVVIEAFMAGLPVIASDLPGPSEIVEHGVNGLIVGTGDANAFADAMTKLATDRALRRRLAAGARASASGFDQERVLPRLVEALGLLPAEDAPEPPPCPRP